MIIETQEDVTRAVLEEMHRTPDPRTKELLSALVRHLHAFVRETRMTEKEFQAAIGYLNANPPLESLVKIIEMKVALMLTTNNLSTSGFKLSLASGDIASGVDESGLIPL